MQQILKEMSCVFLASFFLLLLPQVSALSKNLFSSVLPIQLSSTIAYQDLTVPSPILPAPTGIQILNKSSNIFYFKEIDNTFDSGVDIKINFSRYPWISNQPSNIICALAINQTPVVKYQTTYYEADNTIVDKDAYQYGSDHCIFHLNFQKISQSQDQFFIQGTNKLFFGLFFYGSQQSSVSVDFSIDITSQNKNSFSCINNCQSNPSQGNQGTCDSSTGDCQCKSGWVGEGCDKKSQTLQIGSAYTPFSIQLDYNLLTYFDYSFVTIPKGLKFKLYYTGFSDSIICFLNYEISSSYQYLPDAYNYAKHNSLANPGVNQGSYSYFTKDEITKAFASITNNNYRIIMGCHAVNSMYTYSRRRFLQSSGGSQGVIGIQVIEGDGSLDSFNSLSFIIAAIISGSILIALLIFVIVCARKKKNLNNKRRRVALLALDQLHRSNPMSILQQLALQQQSVLDRITQNTQKEDKEQIEKQEKEYFQDIEKCFPLMSLKQIKEYYREEVPNIKEEEFPNECAICCCDFTEDPLGTGEKEKDQSVNESHRSTMKMLEIPTQNKRVSSKINSSNSKRNSIQDNKSPLLVGKGENLKSKALDLNEENGADQKKQKKASKVLNQSLTDKQNLRLLTICNHFFHQSCIQDWLKKDKSCPHCRHKIEQKDLNSIKGTIEDKALLRTRRLMDKMKQLKSVSSRQQSVNSNLSSIKKSENNLQANLSKDNFFIRQDGISLSGSQILKTVVSNTSSPTIGSKKNSLIIKEAYATGFKNEKYNLQRGSQFNNFRQETHEIQQQTEIQMMTDGKFAIQSLSDQLFLIDDIEQKPETKDKEKQNKEEEHQQQKKEEQQEEEKEERKDQKEPTRQTINMQQNNKFFINIQQNYNFNSKQDASADPSATSPSPNMNINPFNNKKSIIAIKNDKNLTKSQKLKEISQAINIELKDFS